MCKLQHICAGVAFVYDRLVIFLRSFPPNQAPKKILALRVGNRSSSVIAITASGPLIMLFYAISIPIISALTGSQRSKLVMYLLGLTFLPRIYMLSYFTYRWSYVGTAFAKVVAVAPLALCCILLARGIGMSFPLKSMGKPFFAGALAFGVGLGALLLDAPQPVAIALALLVFTPLLWKTVSRARPSTD